MSPFKRLARFVKDKIALFKFRYSGGRRHIKLGKVGEDLAVNALVERGYRIAERNVIVYRHEIDIVAVDNDTLVIVEVKTRDSHRFGKPLEAIDNKTKSRLRKAAELYTLRKKIKNVAIRFDVVSVDFTFGAPRVEIIRNAF